MIKITNYDKMKGADAEDFFQFVCPHCQTDWLKNPLQCEIIPIGISIRNHEADNSDLPKELADRFDRQPTIWETVLNWNNAQAKKSSKPTDCIIKCKHCEKLINFDKKANSKDLKTILKHHYKEYVI